MHRLNGHIKNYAWGKNGDISEVAKLFSAGHPEYQPKSDQTYAELWMGTHPDGPARLRNSSEKLSSLIARFNKDHEQNEVHLPFIMKIMSIKHTLSLQVHPTKEQAAWLHKKDPINYPDAHHKPELAYALTKFELLCGFRPAAEIVKNMETFDELENIMGEKNVIHFKTLVKKGINQESDDMKQALKKCFEYMFEHDTEFIQQQLEGFFEKLNSGIYGCLEKNTIPVLESMKQKFPSDVGVFAPLYLNHMVLQPGECCYYAAEELHAYLSGECVECVGCSNNTIRAALTSKFIDKEALISVLNYRMTDPSFYLVEPQKFEDFCHVTEYAPDCNDFILHRIEITKNTKLASIPKLKCDSIMIIQDGEALCNSQKIKRGDIFFISANESVQFEDVYSEKLMAYRTFSYESGPDHSKRTTNEVISSNKLEVDRIKENQWRLSG